MTTIRARAWTLVGTAAIVGLGYYVGVEVGMALRFPPATTSVLWPPNAILTAALLLTSPRRWWVCLAGALPVHFLFQSALGWPAPLVGALFLTNCSEALIAAGFIRAFSDAPLRFDTLRRVVVFVMGAGLMAPLLSSFADAAVVQAFQGESFWTVWRTRLFANALTELSVVPLLVLVVTRGKSYLGELSREKILEGALLSFALIVVAVVTFASGTVNLDLPGVPSTPTVFLLPLFLWAALRFGAGGMSAALLVAALTASFAARMGNRPFDVLVDPAESLLALQLYLIVMAIPLFAVAALLYERRRALDELAQRLRFEALLSELSQSFVRSPSERIGGAFDACLRRAGEFFGADRVAVMQLTPGNRLHVDRQWTAEGVARLSDSYSCDMFPWVVDRLLAGQEVICESIAHLPEEARQDRASFVELNLRAALVIPLVTSGVVQGVMSMHMVRSARTWPQGIVAQIRMVAEVLANALGRTRTDDALRSSESMKTAILSSLSSLVAVLDKDGVIIAVNEKWLELARRNTASFAAVDVGVSYVDVCRRSAVNGDRAAAETLAGVESVLNGRVSSFSFEYHCSSDEGECGPEGLWYAMTVTPLRRREGGAVVSHVDVTKRKRAELEAQRARQDLAHFSRVSTMGELTASLAHQLNQPLTAILSNAQAARRILDHDASNLAELRDIVLDIIDDDRRAGEIIQRTRDMLTKSSSDPVVTDANALIRDVAVLMTRRHDHSQRPADARARSGRAARARQPHRAAAGDIEPACKRDRRRHRSARVEALHRRAERAGRHRRRTRVGQGFRNWSPDGYGVERFRGLFHNQACRHGHGPRYRAFDRRVARRPHLGVEQRRPRSHVLRAAAVGA